MRLKAFARRSTLQTSAGVLGVLLFTSANSQSPPPSGPPISGSVLVAPSSVGSFTTFGSAPSGVSAKWLQGALGVGSPAATLFMEQPVSDVVNAPYSAVGDTESVTRFADGNRIVQTTSVRYYRDGRGRTRIERPIPGVATATTVMINDMVNGEHTILYPQAKMAQVIKMASIQSVNAQPGGHQPPASLPPTGIQLLLTGGSLAANMSAPATVSLGEKEIEGVTATGTRWEQTLAAGVIGNDKPITITVEQWYSAELGVMVSASQRTSTGAEVTYSLHDISRSEPDSALFAAPADYIRHESSPVVMTATSKID